MGKKYSGFGKEPAKLTVETKVIQYLARHPDGLGTLSMNAWIDSCTRGGGYFFQEYMSALYSLRDSGRIAFANGVWYLRGAITSKQENK